MTTTLLRRSIAALLLSTVSAQSAESSQWDAQVASCTAITENSGDIYDVSQTGFNSVGFKLRGYSTTPTAVWLKNEEGTVIAYADTGLATTGTITMTYAASGDTSQPLTVHVQTCPNSYNSTNVRAWAGIYEDVTAYKGAATEPTAGEVSAHTPTITLDWQNQEFDVSATYTAALNYAKDASGTLLSLTQSDTDVAYAVNDINIPALTTSISACATLDDNNGLDRKNPLCDEEDLVGQIVTDLENRGTNPGAAQTDNAPLTTTYSGSASAIMARFGVTGTDTCVMYARSGTIGAGAVLGFAKGEMLSIELSPIADAKLYVFSCCGVTVTAGNTPPVDCPDSSLKAFEVDVAAAKEAGTLEIAAALASKSGTQSSDLQVFCTGGYAVGEYVVNTTTSQNCTCLGPADGEVVADWGDCTSTDEDSGVWWTQGQVIAIGCITIAAGAIAIAAVCWCMLQKRAANVAKATGKGTQVQITTLANYT